MLQDGAGLQVLTGRGGGGGLWAHAAAAVAQAQVHGTVEREQGMGWAQALGCCAWSTPFGGNLRVTFTSGEVFRAVHERPGRLVVPVAPVWEG